MRLPLAAAALLLLTPAIAAAAPLTCTASRVCEGEACSDAEGQAVLIDSSGGGLAVTTDLGPAQVTGESDTALHTALHEQRITVPKARSERSSGTVTVGAHGVRGDLARSDRLS